MSAQLKRDIIEFGISDDANFADTTGSYEDQNMCVFVQLPVHEHQHQNYFCNIVKLMNMMMLSTTYNQTCFSYKLRQMRQFAVTFAVTKVLRLSQHHSWNVF